MGDGLWKCGRHTAKAKVLGSWIGPGLALLGRIRGVMRSKSRKMNMTVAFDFYHCDYKLSSLKLPMYIIQKFL